MSISGVGVALCLNLELALESPVCFFFSFFRPIGALLQPLIAQIAASGHNIPNFHLGGSGIGSSANARGREDSPDLVKLNSDIEEAR